MAPKKATNEKPEPAPVMLTNVVCPRCESPLCYSPARWLFCPRCSTPKFGTGK